MGTVKVKDKELEVSTDYEALVLAIQELANEIRKVRNG